MGINFSQIFTPNFNFRLPEERPEHRECAVCYQIKVVFKKMHMNRAPQPAHYVCFDCYREWKKRCDETRKDKPSNKRLTCPICTNEDCYTYSESFYIMCYLCRDLRKIPGFAINCWTHITNMHPERKLCFQCLQRSTKCPICYKDGPLMNSVWDL